MCPGHRQVSLGIGDETFPDGLHVCYIYNDDQEHSHTLARFFEQGVQAGDKALCLVENMDPAAAIELLGSLGVDVKAAGDRLIAQVAGETYCPEEAFAPDTLLTGLRAFILANRDEGYSGTRIAGDMSWMHRKGVSVDQVLEYEVKVRDYIEGMPCTAICEYDARKFDGSMLMDVLSVHPAVIVNGQIVRNPYYLDPKDFLARYRARRTAEA